MPHLMLAAIGDVCRDGVDPIERVENAKVAPVCESEGVWIWSVRSSRRRVLWIASAGRAI